MSEKINETPLMKQYNTFKAKYPDAVLLFRVGDFYETFGEDAVRASKILGIVLTHRSNGAASKVELAGFPHHALDTYLPKLVRAGLRVAICDQLEDPKLAKTIVKRGVTELVTP
ncbi:MAG: DNA mismatch repair protein MutS, partial [Lentimicrobiaceae bacterium]|nr:DNA mismatch repair protein MutS [Lentimicrobiaceae bacterium]